MAAKGVTLLAVLKLAILFVMALQNLVPHGVIPYCGIEAQTLLLGHSYDA